MQPQRLYVTADGPRPNRPADKELCAETRAIATQVDWPCELLTNFSPTNKGCRLGVSSGIDWFFEHEEEGIIIEDDCLLHPTFFRFAEELLNYYRDDTRVMHISSMNQIKGKLDIEWSYYFSNYEHIWGWATWRRAWLQSDISLLTWPEAKRLGFIRWLSDTEEEAEKKEELLDMIYNNRLNTWDYQWHYSKLMARGLTINPGVNMVENIGFGPEATHTMAKSDWRASLKAQPIEFPLVHPPFMVRNRDLDMKYAHQAFMPGIRRRIKRLFRMKALFSRS